MQEKNTKQGFSCTENYSGSLTPYFLPKIIYSTDDGDGDDDDDDNNDDDNDDDDKKGGSVGVAGRLAPKGEDRGRACLRHPEGNEQMIMMTPMMTTAMVTMLMLTIMATMMTTMMTTMMIIMMLIVIIFETPLGTDDDDKNCVCL